MTQSERRGRERVFKAAMRLFKKGHGWIYGSDDKIVDHKLACELEDACSCAALARAERGKR